MPARISAIIQLFCMLLCLAACKQPNNPPQSAGLTVEQALSAFEIEPGFKIELLAAEPLVSDPVDMEIDEYGRLYVVEMYGYPLDKSGSGIIKLLADTNGDGRMDKSTVFADGLTLPNSIMRWKKGVMITDAPYVLYLEDTDNDGKANIRDTLLTGFALSNPQHNLNSPLLGIDNWIYLAHEGAVATQSYQEEFGDQGTEIYYPKQPGGPRLDKNASGRSVRFRPDQHLLETTSSNTQFGHSFDNWGHHFLVTNSNHIIQEILAAGYLKRNPALVVADATASLSDHGNAAEVFPITTNPENQLLTDIGVITSACGITIYQGNLFPAPYDQASFVAEPVSNLVHVDSRREKGIGFVAGRIHPDKEFLASNDSWFRPVNMYVGPDGALYLVDYYRQIIEHPEWMGEDVVKSGKLYNGHDMGRIYRISPVNSAGPEWTRGLRLGDASNEELVATLANPNAWWRMQAQRLLIDRNARNVLDRLEQMAKDPTIPLSRLHALWTLEGLQLLRPPIIEMALKDPHPGIRENALKLAELHLTSAPELAKALLAMKTETNDQVKFQLLCTLGAVRSADAEALRHQLLFSNISDEWMQLAALSGESPQSSRLLHMVLDSFNNQVPAYLTLVQRISAMTGAGANQATVDQLIRKAIKGHESAWAAPLLAGLADGLATVKKPVLTTANQQQLIDLFFSRKPAPLRKAALDLFRVTGLPAQPLRNTVLQKAAKIFTDTLANEESRVEALQFIALGDPASYLEKLKQVIQPSEPSAVQVEAIRTMAIIPDSTVSVFLLTRWNMLTPGIQDAAMNTFLANDGRITLLLNAIESGKVLPSVVGWPRSVQLMAQFNIPLREKARRLLAKTEAETAAVNKAYQESLTLPGNKEKGKLVFAKNCSSCHQVGGASGISFGPDLGTVHNWSAAAIMANILSPGLSISSGYDLWELVQENGEKFQGVIASETATAIKLKNSIGEVRTINRTEIRSLRAMNMSAMTVGFDQQINQQEMADLLAFLKQHK